MLRRCWVIALVGVFTAALSPAWGQQGSGSYNKEAVKALSKRIDEHLAKVWQKAKVTPAPKADDHVFFRRLNLDLAGRIPDLEIIDDFIGNPDADKRWEAVDKLLDGAEHPHHFANVWRNVMLGYQTNQQFQFLMPQFEKWLEDRIKSNTALDKMVLQLLTSQQGGPNMGFQPGTMAGSPQLWFLANENKAENLAGATSRVFLGVKIECAQCHAHPFAKWKKEQFWEFAAFYSNGPGGPRPPGGKIPQPKVNFQAGREILIPGTSDVVKAKFLTGEEPKWDVLNNSRQVLANWVTSPENPYFAKAMADHIWSYLMGVSILEPIMEPSDDIPMTHPELLNDMAKALIANNFDPKFLIRAIVHTDAYQRSSGGAKLADKEDYHLFVRMPIRAMSPEQLFDSVVFATTSPTSETRKQLMSQPYNPNQFFNPNQLQSPRAQFLNKFQTQDRRYEPQTSILQALFMMNGKFLAERTKVENNEDLQTLANQKTSHEQRLKSLYRMVLSREPRQNEYERLVPYLEKGGVTNNLRDAISDVYWALINSTEFSHNH